jgi:hypothetical protein
MSGRYETASMCATRAVSSGRLQHRNTRARGCTGRGRRTHSHIHVVVAGDDGVCVFYRIVGLVLSVALEIWGCERHFLSSFCTVAAQLFGLSCTQLLLWSAFRALLSRAARRAKMITA